MCDDSRSNEWICPTDIGGTQWQINETNVLVQAVIVQSNKAARIAAINAAQMRQWCQAAKDAVAIILIAAIKANGKEP